MNGFVRRGMLVLALALLPAATADATPSSQPTLFPVVDGGVYAVAVDGTTAYLGGDFTRIGPLAGPMALLSTGDGSVQRTFPAFGGSRDGVESLLTVNAIEPDGEGGWYVGGEFARVAGEFRSSLVHLLPDGSVDPAFRVELSWGGVDAIALDRSTTTLWIGGSFAYVDGRRRPHVAALDAVTGEPRPWLARGTDLDVNAIEAHGDRVYLLGGFSSIEDETHNGVAAIDRDTGRLLDWDPRLQGSGGASDLDVRDGIVYLAGGFVAAGAGGGEKVVAVRESDARLVPVDYAVRSGSVGAIVATDDVLVVGGVENTREGVRTGMAAFDRRTGALLPWFSDVHARASDFAVAGDTLYVNSVWRADGRVRPAAFDLDTGERLAWTGPWPDGGVQTIAVAGDEVAIGGGFRILDGFERRDVAAVDLRTNTVIPGFDAQLEPYRESAVTIESGRVNALAVGGGSLWIGGRFTRAAGSSRPWLTRVDRSTGAAAAAPPAPNWTVESLFAHDDRLYVGGEFTGVAGQTRYKAAAIDLGTGTLTPFAHNFDCEVESFMPFGAELLLGGCFGFPDRPGGGLAVVDPETGATDGVTPPVAWPEYISTVAPDGEGGAWVGGSYTELGPGGPENFGRIRADGSVDPRAPLVDSSVSGLAAVGSETYVVGGFRTIGGQSRGGVASIRNADGAPTRWDPRPAGGAGDVVPLGDGGALVATGSDMFELMAARGVARFGPERSGMAVPVATAAPVVMGEQFVDGYMGIQRTDGGEWTGSPHRRDIVWLRCDAAGAACEDTGRRGTGLQLSDADVGHRLRVEVVAVNDGGESAPIRSAPGPMVMGPRPDGYNEARISGTAKEGSTLSLVSNGDWSGGPTSFRYQWIRCWNWGCRKIPGATGTSYTLTAADINTRVSARITGVNAAGESSRRSFESQNVVPGTRGTPRNTRPPSIAGVMRNPTTLFADPGDWTDYPDEISIRWDRCEADGTACEALNRQGSRLEVGAEDAGKIFRVRVQEWYSVSVPEEVASEFTAPIPAPGAPAEVPAGGDDDPPTGGDDDPPTGGSPSPAGDPSPATTASQRAAVPPRRAIEAPHLEILSTRLRGARRLVVRLRATAPVTARVDFRGAGRRLARTTADLAGTSRVELRLSRAARQQLRRRGTLRGRVVVTAAGATPIRGPVVRLR